MCRSGPMYYPSNLGDEGDFSRVFATAANEKREAEEREQLKLLISLLDERVAPQPAVAAWPSPMWQQQQQWAQAPPWAWQQHSWGYPPPVMYAPPHPPRVENLRVLPSGEIERDDAVDDIKKEGRKGIHTIDDLPRDSVFDMFSSDFFPVDEKDEEAIPIVMQSGRRLKDGKTYHTIDLPGLFAFKWSGLSPETMMTIFSVLAFVALIFAFFFIGRIRSMFVQHHRSREEEANLVAVIDRAVERALERRIASTGN